MAYEPYTLLMKRLNALSRFPTLKDAGGNAWGWRVIDPEPQTPWTKAILTCYDLMTTAEKTLAVGRKIRESDFRYTVFAIAAPLTESGRIVADISLPNAVSSGKDWSVDWDEPGNCAERKILSKRRRKDWSLSEIWLFYTTSSPCSFCADAMLAGLEGLQRGVDGLYKHLVVAFEGCYAPDEGVWRGLPDPKELPERMSYDPRNPGIEFFKVYRDFDACKNQKKQLAEMSSHARTKEQSTPSDLDPMLSVVRVSAGLSTTL